VIVELDAITLGITRRFDVGGAVQDVVVSLDGQTLYAANESGWLDVIHLPSGRRTTTLEFGTPAISLALSADQTLLFVGLLRAGRVVVLQRQGLIERASITTGGQSRQRAHWRAVPRQRGGGDLLPDCGGQDNGAGDYWLVPRFLYEL
jgi:hypothetical protein